MIKKIIFYIYFILFYIFFRNKNEILLEEIDNISHFNFKKNCPIPKIIWIYWHDDKIPKFIKLCIDRIKFLHPDYDVRLLNKYTVNDFLDLKIDILEKIMPLANLSDLIRLSLLYKYGGVWMDASIILEKNIEEFFLIENNEQDLIAFYNKFQSTNINLPVIESWMLAAPPKSNFIAKWLEYYSPVSILGSAGLFKKFSVRSDFKDVCKGLGNPEYLIVYIACRIAYEEMLNKSNIILYPCDNTAFSVQIHSKWKIRKCIVNFYVRNKFIRSPIYKLTSVERNYLSSLKKFNMINKKSIIGIFLREMSGD